MNHEGWNLFQFLSFTASLFRFHFSFPAAAEGAVELDDGEELVELGLDEGIFGGEEQLLFSCKTS